MKTAGIILGAVALLLWSAPSTMAFNQVYAGPLPLVFGYGGSGTLTCSAFNNTFKDDVHVDIVIVDALGKNVKLDFCILKSFEICSTEVEIFGPENGGVKKSPFTCTIEVDIQGSICGVGHEPNGRPGSSYCLPGISVPVP